jgi:hypothetical protein
MAAKVPTTVQRHNVGSLSLVIADFDNTVASNDIDDNDTWVSGITQAVGWVVQPTIDGPSDCTIDAYDAATGTFTFGSAASQTAKVFVFCKG